MNIDRSFAKSIIDDMTDICKIFGNKSVTFYSNDDKARVPLGMAAANKQSPILTHLDYKVKLPDHTFSIGDRHKLIPSVYANCVIDEFGKLTYSGNTCILLTLSLLGS